MMCSQKEIDMSDENWTYLKVPDKAWNILIEALVMDMDSTWKSPAIREEISRAVDTIETLRLVVTRDVVLNHGDLFDIRATEEGVVITRHQAKKTAKS